MTDENSGAKSDTDFMGRMLFGFICAVAVLLGAFQPGSLPATLIHAGESSGRIMIFALGALGVAIMADAYVNDYEPPDRTMLWTSRHRHILLMAASILFLSADFCAFSIPGMIESCWPSSIMYFGIACFGSWIAWRDLSRRPGHVRHGN